MPHCSDVRQNKVCGSVSKPSAATVLVGYARLAASVMNAIWM